MSRRRTTTARGYGYQWQKLRLDILTRDRYICHWQFPGVCAGRANSVDHVRPKIEGGTNHPTNLVASCVSCNSHRSMQWVNANRGRRVFKRSDSLLTTT